jgi:hypothetical protein
VPPSRSLCRHGAIGRWNGVGTALKRANGPQVGLTTISSLPPRRDTLPHDASGPVQQEGCTRPGRSGSGSSASPCWTARPGPITRPRRGTRALQRSPAILPAVASRPATGACDAHGRTVIPPTSLHAAHPAGRRHSAGVSGVDMSLNYVQVVGGFVPGVRRKHCPCNASSRQQMHTNTPGAYSEDTQIRAPDNGGYFWIGRELGRIQSVT